MRIKLDENIAASAAVRLTALGHEVHTVIEEDLSGRIDNEVWAAAQLEKRFLITQDLDFSDRRRFAAGNHAGILLVRLPDPIGALKIFLVNPDRLRRAASRPRPRSLPA